ncbi:hypothetical protein [Hwangdonia lutea]|uniref:Outer membrane protein beta-barrel domain-containing protein n=1 Tax=Hwangdonia lutea TaxID=3075823 RepID=A0AA97EQ31_9FLAO|nr:hypothetical protein [Hwangdonia sp. SCSIO 19198]WOD45021.1 hypothetical protein RNZ46_07080 [Hwangdonia sp. SCSIO 19198]
MNNNGFFLLVALTLCFVTKSFSQKGHYRIQNGFGIGGGMTQFNITTDNFTTNSSHGFLGGMSSTVNIPTRWYDISFGMQLSENRVEISARPTPLSSSNPNEFITYKMFAAQVAMLMHIKVVPDFVTIDLGPMLQYNGKLELKDEAKKGYYINNYNNLMAKDITNISQFNINGAIGASVGIKNVKLKAQYIYGFTNILKKLNSENLDASDGDSKFKGNQTMLVLGAMVYF